MDIKKGEKICVRCHKNISKDSRYVEVITTEKEKIIDDKFFHFNCWGEYYKDAVKKQTDKIKQVAGGMAKNVMQGFSGFGNNMDEVNKNIDKIINSLPA